MKNRMLTDSIALASVKVFTMATSILATMILSRTLPLSDYGTYSAGNLIINTATLLSAFGLMDAVNFYYNGKKNEAKTEYTNTVFFLISICGVIAAFVIIAGQKLITQYFHNPMLTTIYAYIAFRPLLQNYTFGLQNLQVSIGKAKVVAIRNAVLSATKLGAIILTAVWTRDINTIFKCMLIVEIIALLFYNKILKINNVHVLPHRPEVTKIKEILCFCIPMGVYIQTNTLSRDLDKFIIGFFESTEKLAVYTNCSAKLPFDVISGPLLMLLIPVLTRCIQNNDNKNGTEIFKCYIKIGYIFTLTLGFGCIVVAKQAVQFLYGEKFIQGVGIFVVYIIVDMINFISYSLVLSAKGKTKDLMYVSCGSLVINLFINYLFYQCMGFIGPAIATVIITLGVSSLLLIKSAKILETRIHHLFDKKHLLIFGSEIIVLSVFAQLFKSVLLKMSVHYFIILCLVGAFFVITMLVLNLKEIKKCFGILNTINRKEI